MPKNNPFFFWFLPLQLLAAGPDNPELFSESRKKRYSIGIIPALAFDSDLGFKYGAVFNLFDYGLDNYPPYYDQHLYVKFTNTTKGSLQFQALHESETMIHKAKLMIEASYLVDLNMDFFGFNGINSVYSSKLTEPANNEFINKQFYTHERKLFRLRMDLQKYLYGSKLRLVTGYTYNHYSIAPTDIENHHHSNESHTGINTLFDYYTSNGIIEASEAEGGKNHLFTLGLIYDSRNDPCYCTKGIWFESMMVYSPDRINQQTFSKFVITYRQYVSTVNEKFTLSFRVSSQQKVSGEIPFYLLPMFYDSRLSQDGLGGAYNLRGAMRNRIVSNGFITGNFEIKMRFLRFHFLKQNFFASTSLFYDNAYITKSYKTDTKNIPADEKQFYFRNNKQKVHHTFGSGVYLIFNRNNVISLNYGIPLNSQDGRGGLYIGSNLLF